MKKEVLISTENGKCSIHRKSQADNMFLSDALRVHGDRKSIKHINSCYNIIKVSSEICNKLNGAKNCTLFNPESNKFCDVIIDVDDELKDDIIRFTPFISKHLEVQENSEMLLIRQNLLEFNKVLNQKLENILEDNICISQFDAQTDMFKSFSRFGLIEVLNTETNDCFFIKSAHIVVDDKLGKSQIRLSRKQRIMLSDSIPARLTFAQWEKIEKYAESEYADNSDEQTGLEIIKQNKLYKKDDNEYILQSNFSDLDYSEYSKLQHLFSEALKMKIAFRPVIETFNKKSRKSIIRCVSDFFVGKSTLSLECRRPYSNDESTDIVRISRENMKRLGIEEMEKVIVQYKDKKKSCRALVLDDETSFYETNVQTSIMDFSIGIPAHIRNELGIVDIQSSVKVDRDTLFLMKKSNNEQIVPILLAVFSLNIFQEFSVKSLLPFVIPIILIVVYINLSSKRNMRMKKGNENGRLARCKLLHKIREILGNI